ncbi:MAG: SdrD B-like domain-containing protein, partial [Bacteroidota bacterium]
MKNIYRFIILLTVLIIPFSQLYSQEWMKNVNERERNFYRIQKEFQQFYDGKEPERGEEDEAEEEEMLTEGWMLYKRWEWFWSPRVYPTGKLPRPDILEMRMKEYAQNHSQQKSSAANWTIIGPSVVPSSAGGAGRVNCVAVNPTNTSIIFIGSAGGGLWKSTNGGTSWSTNTDALGSIGITAIAFDPTTTNTMYIATGDADASDTYSIGVLKSTDGGSSWNSTGLNYTVNQTTTIRALVSHPTNSNILFATTNTGIYRTTDAGANWSSVASGSFRDLEINKTDPTVLYATINSDGIYKSTNGGTSFSKLTTGLPTSGIGRIGIAIAPSAPANVYALYVNSTSGFYGLYKSTDAGANWTLQSNTPNILSWDGTGSDGQGWYDLVIDVDPNNANTIYTGGVNMYKSTTSGTSWTKITHWYSGAGYPYIHADQHGMTFLPGSSTTFFVGNDGGIFKTTDSGTSWSDLSNGLAITQFYRLGTSATNVNRIYAGAQDNGTDRVLNGSWTRIIGGDGMEALIDYSDENYGYGELYYGALKRTTNGGSSFSSITSGIGEDGGWVTPYVMNPVNPHSLYLGTTKIYKTLNRGTSWTAISDVLNGATFVSLAVAPSDTNTIYASTSSSLYKTTNNGGAWTSITAGLPVGSITYLAVQPNNAQVLYATFSGYSSQKVYKTTNGGTNWTNISTGLPSIPINCVTVHPTVPNEVWVGTDVGVYHSSTSGNTWELFTTNLPNVVVNELEVHLSSSKLRAATYGRGIWETPITVNNTSIAGMKFNDMNGNGVKDAGETGLLNWRIKISGAISDSILTSASGEYMFSNLNAGNYTVSEVQKSGWTQTAPAGGIYSVTLSLGQAVTGRDFGNRPIGNISGMKFKDVNGNGIKDAGETGLANWKIKINGTYIDSVLTDATGNYSFIITQAGTFLVAEVQQNGWSQTMPVGGTYSLSFTNGNSYTNIDFGNKTVPLANLATVDFEDGNVPPLNWTLNNPDNDDTWLIYSTSGYGVGAKSAKFDFYSYASIGKIDELVTPIVTGYLATDSLLFDYAYAEYSATYVDSFRVQMSLDGGTTFPVSLFYAWSASLATAPTTTSAFVPTSTQWKTQRIPLGAQVIGQNVILKFKAINGYGNNMYLDNVRIKAGAIVYGSVSGMKFNDANANGVKDAGEVGIANWKIKISGMKNDSTVTDANGNFAFNTLVDGNYTISEVQQSGWQQTFPVSPSTYSILISGGNNMTGKNFGNTQFSSISGNVFNDANNNGIKDAGETNLSGWKIKLSGAKTDSVNTDANGNYTFTNLLVGNYTVAEVVQSNWVVTVPPSPFNYSVSITAGNSTITAKNFGNFLGGSIYGNAFLDMNGNGVKDNGESGIQNWKIKISGAKNDSTLTDVSGNYSFLGLINGSYAISEVLSSGYYQTVPLNPATYAVAVASGGNVFINKNFGLTQFSSVSGTVFVDNNGNGIKDVGEITASNWKLKLTGSTNDSTTSDANGNYIFQNVKAGSYTVSLAVQSGWMQTLPVASSYSLNVLSGNTIAEKQFGIFQLATFSGNVFEDMNGNGTKENGDNNLQGWKIYLSGTKADSAETDANGNYTFANLVAGNYSIAEKEVADWLQIAPDSTFSFIPVSGIASTGNNFASFHYGKISGTVFNDYDGDIVMDDEEGPVVNAMVYLSTANNIPIDSTITDGNGDYEFSSLMSGEKKVHAKITDGNTVVISLNNFTATVTSGSIFSQKNLALFYPATISGMKFHDRNANGIVDEGEEGLSNVAVYLSGSANDTVDTDENGLYSFENVSAGTYSVSAGIEFFNGIASTEPKNIAPTSGGDFVNNNFGEYKPAHIEVRKYLDDDGNIATVNDQILKEWNLYVYKSSVADSLINTANSSSVTANNVKPGAYFTTEYDSTEYELLAVYIASTDVTSSTGSAVNNQTGKFTFNILSGDTTKIRYINHYKDTAQFRTFPVSIAFSEKSKKLSV